MHIVPRLPFANKHGQLGRCVQCPYISAYNCARGTMLSIAEQGFLPTREQDARTPRRFLKQSPIGAKRSARHSTHARSFQHSIAMSFHPFLSIPPGKRPQFAGTDQPTAAEYSSCRSLRSTNARSQHNYHAVRAFLILPIHSLGTSEARPQHPAPTNHPPGSGQPWLIKFGISLDEFSTCSQARPGPSGVRGKN